MFKTGMAAIAISALLCAPAFAQATSGSTASSGSVAGVSISNKSKSGHRVPGNVVAPSLGAAGIETCLGSASGGVSFPGGGVAFGSTTQDKGCNLRLWARTLGSMGLKGASVAIACQDPNVFAAMATAGTPCPGPVPNGVKMVSHADTRDVTYQVHPNGRASADNRSGWHYDYAERRYVSN